MRSFRRLVLALALLSVVTGGCGNDGDGGDAATTTTVRSTGGSSSSTSTTSTTLDRSAFCENLRALEGLGGAEGQRDGDPAEVVAQAEQMLDLLDEIQTNVPDDAPAVVASVIDDLRAIADAVGAAAGDVDAAYAAIQSNDPALWSRLQDPSTHRAAFDFFAARCGTAFA